MKTLLAVLLAVVGFSGCAGTGFYVNGWNVTKSTPWAYRTEVISPMDAYNPARNQGGLFVPPSVEFGWVWDD